MSGPRGKLHPGAGWTLPIGFLATLILSHSVHVYMFDVLGVPSAPGYPLTGLLPWVTYAVLSFAALAFWSMAQPSVARLSRLRRCLLLFAILAGLRGQLIRAPAMDGVVTGAWRYALIANLPKLLPFLSLACLVDLFKPPRGLVGRLIAAAALGAVFLMVRSVALAVSAPLLEALSGLAHDEIWKPPYDWHVDGPSYLSFSEPVAAGFVVAALAWDGLPRSGLRKFGSFVLLLMAMDRTLLGPLVYAAAGPGRVLFALVSFGQFWLQSLVQASMTWLTWTVCGQRAAGRGCRPSRRLAN